jgi:ankyrin repeat protein
MGRVLLHAAENGLLSVVELCMREGTSGSVTDEFGRTPLILAVIYGHVKIVQLLLEHMESWRWADHKDKKGKTARDYAVEKNVEVIKLLGGNGRENCEKRLVEIDANITKTMNAVIADKYIKKKNITPWSLLRARNL